MIEWDLFFQCKTCKHYTGDISKEIKTPKCKLYSPSTNIENDNYKIIIKYKGCSSYQKKRIK